MPTIDVLGATIHYEEQGAGDESLLFSHGLLMSSRMYAAQLEALKGRYRCVAYDHRGQGKSSAPGSGAIAIDTVTWDAAGLIEALKLGPCHFVGLSMGGFVGMRLAARRPDLVRSLVLLATTALPEPRANIREYRLLQTAARWLGFRPVAGAAMAALFGKTFLDDPARADERASWKRHLIDNPRSVLRALQGVLDRTDASSELSRIKAPTLVLHGEEDAAIPMKRAEALARGIDGASIVRIPRAGHSLCIEEPGPVTEAIGTFLGSLAPARP